MNSVEISSQGALVSIGHSHLFWGGFRYLTARKAVPFELLTYTRLSWSLP